MEKNTDEQLDVLDEFGKQTGASVSRTKAHSKGILHGASHVYIYRKNANDGIDILLQRRSPNKDSFPNCLDISSAGHMTGGMNFEETAIRELKEELGIDVDASELEYAFTQRISKESMFRGEKFIDNEINKIYMLNKDLDISSLELQEEEVPEVIWMDGEEISKRLEAGDTELCLNEKEYNGVLAMIKRSLQNNTKNGLSYLKVKISSPPSIPDTHSVEHDSEISRE